VISHGSCAHDESRAPRRLRVTAFWLLGRASRTAQQLTRERLAASGMRRGYYGVLATLDEFGPAAQTDIGRRLCIDPSDMVAILNELEDEDYVSRDRDPADRRRNSVTLTGAGRDALSRFDRAIAAAQDAVLAAFSPADREQLVGLLERLVSTSVQATPASHD
jgi:MarR family transcriptional regulator, lower aerobic nicotinate degradation pathway regulator